MMTVNLLFETNKEQIPLLQITAATLQSLQDILAPRVVTRLKPTCYVHQFAVTSVQLGQVGQPNILHVGIICVPQVERQCQYLLPH